MEDDEILGGLHDAELAKRVADLEK